MYKYLLASIEDINWLAIVPLVIFFVFFACIIYSTLKTKKSHVEKMEKLPLQ